jgi:hypothetical protein
MTMHNYIECGLTNVYLKEAGEPTGYPTASRVGVERGSDGSLTIFGISRLHRAIAEALLLQPGRLSLEEIRFLGSWAGEDIEIQGGPAVPAGLEASFLRHYLKTIDGVFRLILGIKMDLPRETLRAILHVDNDDPPERGRLVFQLVPCMVAGDQSHTWVRSR